jgi:integrase
VTKGGKIKDQRIIDACENTIRQWRSIIANMGARIDLYDAKGLAEYLRTHKHEVGGFRLDIVEHIRTIADTKGPSTAHNYRVLASSLDKFLGRSTDINDISAQVVTAYEMWLRKNAVGVGTICQYMALLKASFNAALFQYNDEEEGIVRITRNPFKRYKLPAQPAPSDKSIDLKTLQAIADLEDEPRFNSARNVGRDLFMLSFALGGINYVDLYNLPYSALKGDYIEYQRQKTKGARADGALYRVSICPEVRPLVERWLDPTRRRLFRFYEWSDKSFSVLVSRYIKLLEKAVPYERHYIYYSARHTYASLARNECGIDKYTVHELLNHSDAQMKITDRYIRRDWQRLFDAHSKVIALVDWSRLCLH